MMMTIVMINVDTDYDDNSDDYNSGDDDNNNYCDDQAESLNNFDILTNGCQ